MLYASALYHAAEECLVANECAAFLLHCTAAVCVCVCGSEKLTPTRIIPCPATYDACILLYITRVSCCLPLQLRTGSLHAAWGYPFAWGPRATPLAPSRRTRRARTLSTHVAAALTYITTGDPLVRGKPLLLLLLLLPPATSTLATRVQGEPLC